MTQALYVHVPFCDKICAYCDFVRVRTHPTLITDYLRSLKDELASTPSESYTTIYIGGGTPSALSVDQLRELLEILKPVSHDVIEYTIEVNPESLTPEKATLMTSYGINRVSLGVQTFDAKELRLLNRSHLPEDIVKSIKILNQFGITNISIDLIYGLPLQTLESFESTLTKALSLPVTHLSLYSLTIEPHSEFGRKNVQKAPDELEEAMYFKAVEVFKTHGFHQYEISNFTRNHPSLHNQTYWHYDDYLGIGPGAVSLIKGQRIENTANLLDYAKGKWHSSIFPLSLEDQRYEFMMMGLRMKEGIALARYEARFHEPLIKHYGAQIQKLIGKGWLELNDTALKATESGYPLLNTVLIELLNE